MQVSIHSLVIEQEDCRNMYIYLPIYEVIVHLYPVVLKLLCIYIIYKFNNF
jgi:hypothetical protein